MIIHIDMDAFYASVEERENPELVGNPVVVGGQPSRRGVVAAANYEARRYGVHSAMAMSAAVERCPDLVIVKPHSALYSQVSQQVRRIFDRYTPIVEPLSLDEAFLDPRGSERLHGTAATIGTKIKRDIKTELKLVASVGVAPNKFLAKLASDYDKPDGFTVIHPREVQRFLDPLSVSRIWGVGKAASAKLAKHRILTVSDLRKQSPALLDRLFGQYGKQLWRLAHGLDDRKVTPDSEVKSISQETTFDQDITEYPSIESTTLYLTEGVCFRLRDSSLQGRTVTLKIRFDDFRTITRSRTLDAPTDRTRIIWRTVREILEKTLKNKRISIRLMGVGVSNFGKHGAVQASIFEHFDASEADSGGDRVDQLSDAIKRKYGEQIIKMGKSIR